jgi:hypothetical protein
VEVFLDCTNFGAFISKDFFGYYEEVFRTTNDVFRRQFIGAASYNAAGQIRPTSFAPDNFLFDNVQSRWRMSSGIRLRF